jgi:hypothetical protein
MMRRPSSEALDAVEFRLLIEAVLNKPRGVGLGGELTKEIVGFVMGMPVIDAGATAAFLGVASREKMETGFAGEFSTDLGRVVAASSSWRCLILLAAETTGSRAAVENLLGVAFPLCLLEPARLSLSRLAAEDLRLRLGLGRIFGVSSTSILVGDRWVPATLF